MEDTEKFTIWSLDPARAKADALKALDTMYELLEEKRNWTQDVSARDIAGEATYPQATEAVCWCLLGSFEKALHELDVKRSRYDEAETIVMCALAEKMPDGYEGAEDFNDSEDTKHSDVLKLLRDAREWVADEAHIVQLEH